MRTKKEILEHCIEILYEQLIMSEINLKYVEQRNTELGDKDSFEYQATKTKMLQEIDGRMRQVEIAKEMLKNYE